MSELEEQMNIHDAEGALLAQFVKSVQSAIDDSDYESIRKLADGLHDSDLADLIENLSTNELYRLVQAIGSDINPTTLTEVDETVRDESCSAAT